MKITKSFATLFAIGMIAFAPSANAQEKKEKELNAEWSQDAQDELQDFIESQGIYIRQ